MRFWGVAERKIICLCMHSFLALVSRVFSTPKRFISADKHFTFKNDWLVCTHHYYVRVPACVCVCLLINAIFFSLVGCHAIGKIQPNSQNKPQFYPHISFSMPRNLFTMTLVNRSCASSANLMSKPFLIYCRVFFPQTTQWVDANTKLLYTRHIVFYTHTEEWNRFCLLSFIKQSQYQRAHIARECI